MIRAVLMALCGVGLAAPPGAAAQEAKAKNPPKAQAKAEKKSLVGTWLGTLEPAPGIKLRLVVKVRPPKDGKGEPTAAVVSPDQTPDEFPADSLKLDGKKLAISVNRIGARYEGTIQGDYESIDGQWIQGGNKLALVLKPTDEAALAGPAAPKEVEGLWEGKIQVTPQLGLRLVLRVEKAKDGDRLVPYLDSPDQNVNGIPVTSIALKDGKLDFAVTTIGGKFQGTLDEKKGEIAGQWSQAGQSFPLTLKKTDKPTEPRRSQVIKPPFPYRSIDVTFENKPAGVSLAGTLTLPPSDGPFPAVVLVSGSGPQDRDETLLGHKPFLVLADALTRRGIAVLRYDDRGTAESTGDFRAATTADFATDARAAVAFLKSRPEVDQKRIGIVGHSEGGLIAPIVATETDDVAFIVLLAGPGVPGDQIVEEQGRRILEASGGTAEQVQAGQFLSKLLLQLVTKARQGDPIDLEETRAALAAEIDKQPEDLRPELRKAIDNSLGLQLRTLSSPWFRYFLTYDPRPTLEKVRCPVLALNGSLDLQVWPSQNLPEIEKALKAGGNPPHYTLEELPGLNHLFQPCQTGSPLEYASIEITMDPIVPATIADWIASLPPSHP